MSLTDSRKMLVREVIDRAYKYGVVPQEDGKMRAHQPVSIPAGVGEALRDLVVKVGAMRTFETGFAYGLSTLFICEGILSLGDSESKHIAIDPHQARVWGNAGIETIRRAGVRDLVEHLNLRSQLALPQQYLSGARFDLAFLDGDHRYDGIFIDLYYADLLVDKDKPIIVDDAGYLPAVRTALSFFVENRGWRYGQEPFPGGTYNYSNRSGRVAVMYRDNQQTSRPWYHFMPFIVET